VVALAEPAPNGNGHGPDEPAAQTEPPVETTQERTALQIAALPETGAPPAAPPEAPALLPAARAALEEHNLRLAQELYCEALEQHPDDVAARSGLALVLEGWGEHQAALAQLDHCRTQDEGNVDVLINRCGVLGSLGRYGEAERGLRGVLEREPGNAAAHFQLGVVASRRGRWRDAVPILLRATALDANLSGAHFYLGEALNHVDDLPGALQAYQRAVELSPHNPKAWYGMGIVLDRMNRPDEAAQLYRRSRQLQGK